MSEQAADGWGINPVQAGIAAVSIVVACALALALYVDVPGRDVIEAEGSAFRFDVVQDGVTLRPHGTVLKVGSTLDLRVSASRAGHVLVYRSDGDGHNQGVWPGGFESQPVEPGNFGVDAAWTLDTPGTWYLTGVFCDDAFEIDPKKPKSSWSCKIRDFDFVIQ